MEHLSEEETFDLRLTGEGFMCMKIWEKEFPSRRIKKSMAIKKQE